MDAKLEGGCRFESCCAYLDEKHMAATAERSLIYRFESCPDCWSGGEWVTQYGVITKVLYAGSNPVLTTQRNTMRILALSIYYPYICNVNEKSKTGGV